MQQNTEYKEFITSLSLKYCKNWNLWEAIREIVQNTLDETGKMPQITQKNGNIEISDDGQGISLKQLCLLGISEKNNIDARGQYGEGLKVALLIFVRMGHIVTIESKNFTCEIDAVEQFDEKVIRYRYVENTQRFQKGTKITIHNFNEKIDFNDRFNVGQKQIIHANPELGAIIAEKEPKLYVKNIYVQDLNDEKALYSYDLRQINLERDRNTPNMYQVQYQIGALISGLNDKKMIEKMYKIMQKGENLESKITYFRAVNRDMWKSVFFETYGEKAVIGCTEDTQKMAKARYHGFKPVIFANTLFFERLKYYCEIPDIDDAIIRKQQSRKEKSVKNLKKIEKNVLTDALKIVTECTDFKIPELVFYSTKQNDVLGYASDTKIGINRIILNDLGKTLTCLVEELVHYNTGMDDATPEFQKFYVHYMSKVLSYITKPKNTLAQFEAKLIIRKLKIKNWNYIQYSVNLPMKLNEKLSDKKTIKISVEA
ncbi:MAG: ATP-binding protein [Candidatus Bathyarchaeota archaeon]|nr:ATP-binding protein [Candidatus Bathyarchaeota archaeon]